MIVIVGLSHKTAPIDLRERLGGGSDLLRAMLARLGASSDLEESAFLSTCNRVEVFARPAGDSQAAFQAAFHAMRSAMAAEAHTTDALLPHLYEKTGRDAVKHLFRVASSLDSMVLGEPQILGQVKDAFDAAQCAGTLRGVLGRSLTHAFAVAKRVRTETRIGEGSVSISSIAVDLAERIFGDLSKLSVLLVGAGEMAEASLRALGKGARAVRVCNRNFERAVALASQYGGSAAPLDALAEELVLADVVLVSTASPTYVVTPELVAKVMKQRRGRTLFFVDISVPRNVDPAIHGVDNVFVYNVDDLEQQVSESQLSRHQELVRADRIVDEELAKWTTWQRTLDVKPTLVALRARTRSVLNAELERTLGKLPHLGSVERLALEQMLESATNKLLHAPTQCLKEEGDEQDQRIRVVRDVFRLDEAAAPAKVAAPALIEAPAKVLAPEPDEPVASATRLTLAKASGGGTT